MLENDPPQALEEAVSAFNTGVRPLQRLIGGRSEHDEQARRIGTELVNQSLRINAVILGLGHLLGAADHHRLAVRAQSSAGRTTTLIMNNIDISRVDPLFLAVCRFTIESRGDDHALRQQVGKGLAELAVAEQANIAHQLGPEARIEQVQDGVLDAADVLVDTALAPVIDALIDHRLVVIRAAVAQEVPRRFDEGIHRIGLAARRLAAFRTGAFIKRRHLGQRTAGTGDRHVFRQNDWQLLVRHRHVAAVRAMDDRNRATPVALARNAPVAQAELHFFLAEALRGQIGGNGVDRCLVGKTGVFA